MKKVIYSLFAIALLLFMCVPDILDSVNASFGTCMLAIASGFVILMALVNKINEFEKSEK